MTIRDLAELIVKNKFDDQFIQNVTMFNALVWNEEKNLRKCYISDGKHIFVTVRVEDKIP